MFKDEYEILVQYNPKSKINIGTYDMQTKIYTSIWALLIACIEHNRIYTEKHLTLNNMHKIPCCMGKI